MIHHPGLAAQQTRGLAKLRSVKRRNSRGAVMFIVAMTLAVLAALGGYAMVQASDEIRTSGYERQSAQSHYLSEYGVLGGAANVNPVTAQLYVGLMLAQSGTGARNDTGCVTLPGVTASTIAATKACRRMGAKELQTTSSWPATAPPAFGSAPISGDFFVELTDPVQSQPPTGFDLRLGLCFVQFTLSSVGMVQSAGATTDGQLYGNEALEMARARITAGPIRCSQ